MSNLTIVQQILALYEIEKVVWVIATDSDEMNFVFKQLQPNMQSDTLPFRVEALIADRTGQSLEDILWDLAETVNFDIAGAYAWDVANNEVYKTDDVYYPEELVYEHLTDIDVFRIDAHGSVQLKRDVETELADPADQVAAVTGIKSVLTNDGVNLPQHLTLDIKDDAIHVFIQYLRSVTLWHEVESTIRAWWGDAAASVEPDGSWESDDEGGSYLSIHNWIVYDVKGNILPFDLNAPMPASLMESIEQDYNGTAIKDAPLSFVEYVSANDAPITTTFEYASVMAAKYADYLQQVAGDFQQFADYAQQWLRDEFCENVVYNLPVFEEPIALVSPPAFKLSTLTDSCDVLSIDLTLRARHAPNQSKG